MPGYVVEVIIINWLNSYARTRSLNFMIETREITQRA